MENCRPKDDRPWVSFGVEFFDKEREIIRLIVKHEMVNDSGVFENSFIF